MAGKRTDARGYFRGHRRAAVVLGTLLLAVAGMLTAFFLTRDNEPQIVSAPVIVKNESYDDLGANPLTECRNEDISRAVLKYYARLSEQADYTEAYEDMSIYTKKGLYENTYIVFATYNMKIKGIYTPVPGLGTLYVEQTPDGTTKVEAQAEDADTRQAVTAVTAHEDVRGLFRQVEDAYNQAVSSDALLAEALSDLQNAAGE